MEGVDFFFNQELADGDVENGAVGFRTSFYARRVNVLLAPITEEHGESGRNVVDRGHVLLQREVATDYLRLAFYKREARSEHSDPLVVLPVGFIAKIAMKKAASPTDSEKKKGRIRFYTRCSIDTKTCMDPMVVTVYMEIADMHHLHATLGSMTTKFPNQKLLFDV